MPAPLDEFPIHQAPLPIAHVVSSDRNAYDRCYLNAHDRTGDIFLITGLGVYPNLGTTDAYATVRKGNQQVSVRMSDAINDDRLNQAVGPYRIEVVEPLKVLRLVCDTDDHGIGFDLTWTGSFPATDEVPHVMRQAGKVILDAQRFAQVGTWEGTLRFEGEEIAVTPDRWVGTRDRSWGIRPVGEAEPAGRAAAEADPDFGFWWMYLPLRFDDFALIVIAQEDGHGHRILNEATRVWPAESGRPVEQLGWPRFETRYEPGTRIPTGTTIHLTDPDGTPITVEVTSLGYNPLNCGSGYGGDASWNHGMWKGRDWIDRHAVDLTDPAVAGMVPFGVVDHVGRAVIDGAEGWGLFEHSTVGRHDPSGFADFGSVSP
jgi:hypothetical protein